YVLPGRARAVISVGGLRDRTAIRRLPVRARRSHVALCGYRGAPATSFVARARSRGALALSTELPPALSQNGFLIRRTYLPVVHPFPSAAAGPRRVPRGTAGGRCRAPSENPRAPYRLSCLPSRLPGLRPALDERSRRRNRVEAGDRAPRTKTDAARHLRQLEHVVRQEDQH